MTNRYNPTNGEPLDLPTRPGAGGAGGGWNGGGPPTSNDPRTGTDPNWDTGSFLDWLVPILLSAGIAWPAISAAIPAMTAAGAAGGVEAGVTAGVSAGLPGSIMTLPAISTGIATGAGTAAVGGAAAAGAGAAAGSGAAVGAGGAETGAGVAASTSPSWLNPAITGGIGVAGNLIAAHMNSNAANDAASIAAKSAAEALAYEKERDAYDRSVAASRYGDYTGRIAPYLSNGASSGERMASLLGLRAPAPMTVGPAPPPLIGGGQPPVNRPLSTAPPPSGSSPNASTVMVTMRAPDGSTKTVPQSEVAHWQQQGAVVVGQAA